MSTFLLRYLVIVTLLLQAVNGLMAQKTYPKDYFQPPVDFRMLLSGTFGEIRSNHFHSGIDIKTNGVEGAKVYAVADGYVSRIKVSAWGFGKALYITHPNGFVSVYAHLGKYNKAIGDYVKSAQYNAESFEIELFPEGHELPVKKGDIVAFSGNSGSSGGPHLHFELRDAGTQKIINPLLFGYEVKDFYTPAITSIKIYPEDDGSRVNGSGKAVRFLAEGWGTGHRLTGNPAITLSGNISFAIQAYDRQNDTENKNGPYAISLFIDSVRVFDFRVETFAFDQTRYVNSFLDYEEYIRNGARLQRTCIDPGNRLDMYGNVVGKGIFTFNDSLTHTIRYEVSDVAGNMAVLQFTVRSVKAASFKPQASSPDFNPAVFNYNASNHFGYGNVKVDAPAGAFYDSFEFKYDSARRLPGTFSAVHKIHHKYTPVHESITLGVKPAGLPAKLRSKALIVKVGEGNALTSAGGQWDEADGFVKVKIREFGDYCVAVDTVPPKIRPVKPEGFSNLAGQTKIQFIISDERSGIASYRGTLNGRWILMEYDAKNDLLFYTIDERLQAGQNAFELKVTDGKGNQSSYKTSMAR